MMINIVKKNTHHNNDDQHCQRNQKPGARWERRGHYRQQEPQKEKMSREKINGELLAREEDQMTTTRSVIT